MCAARLEVMHETNPAKTVGSAKMLHAPQRKTALSFLSCGSPNSILVAIILAHSTSLYVHIGSQAFYTLRCTYKEIGVDMHYIRENV